LPTWTSGTSRAGETAKSASFKGTARCVSPGDAAGSESAAGVAIANANRASDRRLLPEWEQRSSTSARLRTPTESLELVSGQPRVSASARLRRLSPKPPHLGSLLAFRGGEDQEVRFAGPTPCISSGRRRSPHGGGSASDLLRRTASPPSFYIAPVAAICAPPADFPGIGSVTCCTSLKSR
jgi:hypothetical protein